MSSKYLFSAWNKCRFFSLLWIVYFLFLFYCVSVSRSSVSKFQRLFKFLSSLTFSVLLSLFHILSQSETTIFLTSLLSIVFSSTCRIYVSSDHTTQRERGGISSMMDRTIQFSSLSINKMEIVVRKEKEKNRWLLDQQRHLVSLFRYQNLLFLTQGRTDFVLGSRLNNTLASYSPAWNVMERLTFYSSSFAAHTIMN